MTEGSPPKVLPVQHADDDSMRSPPPKPNSADANGRNAGSSGGSSRRKGRVSEVRLSEENRRRSPRFSVESDETDSSSRDVKLRRCRSSNGNENMPVVHQKKKTKKVISSSIELPNSSEEQHSPEVDDINCSALSLEEMTSSTWVENGQTNSDYFALSKLQGKPPKKKFNSSASFANGSMGEKSISSFIGDPIPDDEARERWGWRYELKDKQCKDRVFKINEDEEDETIINVKCHYAQAKIGNCIFNIGDCASIEGEEEQKHIGKIVEFFQTTDRKKYFRVQWFYRIQDTVVKDAGDYHDKRRLFYSSIMNDNLIDSIIEKVNVRYIKPKVGLRVTSVSPSNFYYDMEYCVEYSTFRKIPTDNVVKIKESSQPAVLESLSTEASTISKSLPSPELHRTELTLLDLYSGCGGMSTGLCLGANLSSVNLVARWAVDSDNSATNSLKLNHPDTHVRNESAEDFLQLLKEWEKLCKRYNVGDIERKTPIRARSSGEKKQVNSQADDSSDDELEVSRLVDICYGDPSKTGKHSLYLKVNWKGYDESEDTWEPIENLRNCKQIIQDFVREGIQSKLLPLPGEVGVVCGGPPCQGISGYNRYRNMESPLDDERNHQIVVFMDIVKYLKPKYVLMENVVDILRFDKGSLGRYALGRLVHMNYQARLGIVAAGCYGLPQFRLRVFMWGAHPDEVLPQFPLPTHDVIVRYWPPPEYERNTVAYDEDHKRELEKALVIQDAISDLPPVTNFETRDEMPYEKPPETEFQRYIRSTKYEMTGSTLNGTTEQNHLLYDHRPQFMSEDDYQRICQIPKQKGANFRNLPGIVVGADNVVKPHPVDKRPLLPSGKPLVPDYCFTFEQGRSKRPFGRLWWDETVPTALTSPSCHNQIVLHPEQDRILTIREFARLQGFQDYYRFYGSVKARYRQIGNAVAVPVSRALGYALGIAHRKLVSNEHHMTLPSKFSLSNYLQLSSNHIGDSIFESENADVTTGVESENAANTTLDSKNATHTKIATTIFESENAANTIFESENAGDSTIFESENAGDSTIFESENAVDTTMFESENAANTIFESENAADTTMFELENAADTNFDSGNATDTIFDSENAAKTSIFQSENAGDTAIF
ncbi:DNA (cytosine-5)-methyltransferase CMT2-like isoform X1 [Vicia villosa]|uniref:DNA (cytosine-5)-methyltransferase CMT2-like isoform X1 n=1 Tax=Vicia villosa TaxID=3911 RepID=UPI00273B19C4|nr:DNA (cytosine-5)-methyltransferase CMT2-like isoform X1 [Vicia villosa]